MCVCVCACRVRRQEYRVGTEASRHTPNNVRRMQQVAHMSFHHHRLSVCQALSRSLNILNIYYFYDSSHACVGTATVFCRCICSSHTHTRPPTHSHSHVRHLPVCGHAMRNILDAATHPHALRCCVLSDGCATSLICCWKVHAIHTIADWGEKSWFCILIVIPT